MLNFKILYKKIKNISKNKKGTVMIEATIVLPLFILVCGSMIIYSIYEYENLSKQVNAHFEIDKIVDGRNNGIGFDNVKIEKSNDINLGGITGSILEKKIINNKYAFDFANIVRAKQAVSQNINE